MYLFHTKLKCLRCEVAALRFYRTIKQLCANLFWESGGGGEEGYCSAQEWERE